MNILSSITISDGITGLYLPKGSRVLSLRKTLDKNNVLVDMIVAIPENRTGEEFRNFLVARIDDKIHSPYIFIGTLEVCGTMKFVFEIFPEDDN